MRKTIQRTLFLAIAAALLIAAPNLLWLSRSSVLVRNTSAEQIVVRVIIIDQTKETIVVALSSGASEFLWIDPVGEATLTAEVRDGTEWKRHCGEYVEAGMYRVEIAVRARGDVSCHTGLPLLNRLLVRDLLS